MSAKDTLNQIITSAEELLTVIDAAEASVAKIAELNAQIAALQNQLITLQNQNNVLQTQNAALRDQVNTLNATVADRDKAIALQKEYIKQLEDKIKELEGNVPVPPDPPIPPVDKLLKPPAGKIYMGCSQPSGGLTAYKTIVGKNPHIAHAYSTSGATFGTALAAIPTGCIPLINFKPAGSMGQAEYKKIIAGDRDAAIKQAAASAKAYNKPLFWAPLHEPENDDTGPGDADYAKAFRHIVEVARPLAPNAIWVWNMMSFVNHIPRYNTLYPGDDVVDWIGGDPYAHKTTVNLNELGKEFYDWGKAKGKPFMWCEWGYDKPTATAAATTIFTQAELDKMQTAMPLLQALVYWNEWLSPATDPTKDYRLANFPNPWRTFALLPEFTFTVPANIAK